MKNHITYERVVLTLIAGLLLLNFLEARNNQAQFETNKLPAKFASLNAANKNFAIVPVNEDGSIDVRIKSSMETIDVNIESADSYSLNYAGPIEVKIK